MINNPLIKYSEGIRILLKSSERRINGIRKYSGNANEICKQIIIDCWNGKYLMTSAGNFSEFWTRDFGWCSEALVRNGFHDKVKKTLDFALKIFSKAGMITTAINPDSVPFNYPVESIDSIPWLVRSLRNCNNKSLIKKYEEFLNKEVQRFTKFINPATSLVKENHYSSIKDYAIRKSSTYDNVMAAMLCMDLDFLGLNNPLRKFKIKEAIIKNLWTGAYFKDDLINNKITGDSNIFPFSTGVFAEKEMLKSSIKALMIEGLTNPLPVKFSNKDITKPTMYYLLVKNYQGSTVWTHMGPLLIKLIKEINPKKALNYKREYTKIIEKYSNYLEVLNHDLTPFQTRFYMSDESMLWAVNYLDL